MSRREIAPRPPGEVVPLPDPATMARKTKVAIACESCRIRRVKCDGAKPRCQACSRQASECVYQSPANLQYQQQKGVIGDLEKDKSALYEILWSLQNTSPEQATSLLALLRSDQEDLGPILLHFSQNPKQPANTTASGKESPAASTTSQAAAPTSFATTQSLDHHRLLTAQGPAALPSIQHENTRPRDLKVPLEWFFNCVGALFYIMNKDEVEQSIETIANIDAPIGDIVAANKDARTTTIAGGLAGMASIGVLHAQLANSATAPPAELADYFYAVAKLSLDVAIEHDPLYAVKICALIAMYNIMIHATVSLAYLDLGISLARRYGIDAAEKSNLSSAEYDDASRTYRTLVHLQCWLSASLDYLSDALGSAALNATEDPNAPPEYTIRRECVKVSIIKAEMLHRILKATPVPENIVINFHNRLEQFHNQLPGWMTLRQLIADDGSDLMKQFRPIIFYVHLFYLSAMMLLCRRLITSYVATDSVGTVALPAEAQRAIRDGFVAAQTNARVMGSMLAEGKVVQVCWLCIFTSYTAGVMVAYKATQKAIHGLPITADLAIMTKCVNVLSYCALKDAMAGRFRDLLVNELGGLQEVGTSDTEWGSGSNMGDWTCNNVLFDFQEGTSELHMTARRLLHLIQRPVSGLREVEMRSTSSNRAETTMGTHLEWQWEFKSNGYMDNLAEPQHVCDTRSAVEKATEELRQKPAGSAWVTWTPPVGV
ncbi:hypothetical protein BDU57DRAFT_589002 [Ampelomyces quisqualis]|uniref:Zn(2)-C6 fungal-type domain-containing protein n=1 Tax=Ampelomyces quisqualis TaxID=50730 RepID=A0A6A5QIZ4_AMPQU|nr:hypothetical protein BDU57DRAFT_589002 [Ampelomyces quisqualis]